MKLLIPPESRRATRARRNKRRRLLLAGLLAPLFMGVVGFYAWPHPAPSQSDIYQNTDGRVLSSLISFREDHPPQRIDVGGRIWNYVRVGDAPEAVLFLHGMGGAYDVWWQQARALMDRYTVLSISYADEPELGRAALALESLLDLENIRQVHLVGTSMGGYVAQYFAATQPDRVRSLVMSNTFPPSDWIDEEYGMLATALPLLPGWLPGEVFRRTIRRSIFPASGGSHLVRGYLVEQSYRMSKGDFGARLSILRERFTAPDLGALGIPAIIIEADNDPSVPPEVRAELTGTYEVPVITMGDVGHFPYLNRPAAYTSILEDFWSGLAAVDTLDPTGAASPSVGDAPGPVS